MPLRDISDQKSLRRRLTLLVSLFSFIVLAVFLLASFRAMVLSSVRAYIQCESYWSKAQKEAVISLEQYALSESQADFQSYLTAIRVPIGDKVSRLELEKLSPDMEVVEREFERGKNNPSDIPGMARLYRWFRNTSYMHEAIEDWKAGDGLIDELTELADQLHAEYFADKPNPERKRAILDRIGEIDSRATILEDRFSQALADGDTRIRDLLNIVTIAVSLLLLFSGAMFSHFLLTSVKRSEDRYRQLLESASDAILILEEVTGMVLQANARAAELFGIPAEILAGKNYSDLFPLKEEQSGLDLVQNAVTNGEPQRLQLKIRREDGTTVETEATARRVELVGSRQRVVLGIFRDTSELNRLNRALLAVSRSNQELVRATDETDLYERICNVIVKAGRYRMAWVGIPQSDDEKSVKIAAQYGDTSGYLDGIDVSWDDVPRGRGPTGRAIRTKTICMLRDAVSEPLFAPWAKRAIEQGFTSVIALPLLDGDEVFGTLNIYSWESGNVFDKEEVALLGELSNNLAYGVSTIRLRERRERAEAEVRSLEEQLRQAQKMESLGRLAGGVAHDFNNLLTVIRGYAELALPAELPDAAAYELHRKLSEITKAADRAQGLIGQLLAFSRKQILQPRVVDLNQILIDLGSVLPRLIGEDIHLKIHPGPNLQWIKADPNQIQQVILNLAVNARDAMKRGGTLTIETSNRLVPLNGNGNSGERVVLTVSDTGCGISPDVRSRMFEPFFTTKESGKGTGLGLAMVYGTVTQSGGHIEVDSEVGRGASFNLFFPATQEAPPTMVRETPLSPAVEATETILLVEDEPSVRELVSGYLSKAGFRLIEAVNGMDGVEKADGYAGKIDLVITDIVMPGMGGRELAEKLRLSHPDTKILFMSGYIDDSIVRKNISAHQEHFIEKPFHLSALAAKIREVLNATM